MDKLKEENDIKGKVIAIQQKLLEIAVQMFQEKKDECERLLKELDALSLEKTYFKKERDYYKGQREYDKQIKEKLRDEIANLRKQIEEYQVPIIATEEFLKTYKQEVEKRNSKRKWGK
jgi:hypothetical protein